MSNETKERRENTMCVMTSGPAITVGKCGGSGGAHCSIRGARRLSHKNLWLGSILHVDIKI